MSETNSKNKYSLFKTFLTGFLMFLLGMAPLLIMSKGVYLWVGDYDEQTIIFTERISEMLHSGKGLPTYDWGSMLGMDFLTAYGDHIFAPFDWLMYAVPTSVMPYIHAVVMALKIGLAAVTANVYCRRYVKSDRSAYICGMLYAFSGFQLFNLVYQFSSIFLFFPLLLVAFDKLVTEKKPFWFGALLGLICLMNAVFSWMICLFLLIYYVVRTATKSFPRLDLRLFLRLAVETSCGVLIGAMVLLPFAMELSGNQRAGNTIFGHSLICYETPGVILSMLRYLIFPPSMCGYDWYFKGGQLSISPPVLYIPLFLVLGVYIVFRAEKREWFSVLLKVCAVTACVPLFNSAFSVFNNLYYARWLFMPLLIMIMMTGRYIDGIDETKPKKELIVLASVMGFMIVYGVYAAYFQQPTDERNGLWLILASISALGTIVLILIHYPRKELKFISAKNLGALSCLFCFLPFIGSSYFIAQNEFFEFVPAQVSKIWNDFEPIDLKDDEFFRTSSCISDVYNVPMRWGYPTISSFNSMISGETCNFFDAAGAFCTQIVDLDYNDYALCSFLSVKYDLFYNRLIMGGIEVEPEDLPVYLEGFDQSDVVNRYVVYKNKAFIPMGFTFDNYIVLPPSDMSSELTINAVKSAVNSAQRFRGLYDNKADRQKLLLKAIWLTPEQAEKYGDILEELPDDKYEDVSLEAYYRDCSERAASACYEFVTDEKGFNARIDLPKDNLVFFSVPYSKSFTAYVDGEPTEIERVFNGLSAVYVPEGDHSISFRYEIPGFKVGCIVSGASAFILIVYTAVDLILKRRPRKEEAEKDDAAPEGSSAE